MHKYWFETYDVMELFKVNFLLYNARLRMSVIYRSIAKTYLHKHDKVLFLLWRKYSGIYSFMKHSKAKYFHLVGAEIWPFLDKTSL